VPRQCPAAPAGAGRAGAGPAAQPVLAPVGVSRSHLLAGAVILSRRRCLVMTDAERPWVDGLTFVEVLDRTAERHGERDALVFPWLNYRRSYAEFRADVRRAARALMALGINRGDHVGVWATNWPQWVIIQFAAAHVGAVLVNVNPAYRSHELRYVLQQADITTLLLTDRYKTSNYFDLLAEVCPELGRCPPGELRSADCP